MSKLKKIEFKFRVIYIILGVAVIVFFAANNLHGYNKHAAQLSNLFLAAVMVASRVYRLATLKNGRQALEFWSRLVMSLYLLHVAAFYAYIVLIAPSQYVLPGVSATHWSSFLRWHGMISLYFDNYFYISEVTR